MFVQHYNGYYYLTEKRCGQVAKIYLGKNNTITPDAVQELYHQLFLHLKKSNSFTAFYMLFPPHYGSKIIDVITDSIGRLQGYNVDKFIHDFVYHSNKSEGSRIAYDDFIKIIQKKKPNTTNRNEIQEVENSFLARDFLMDGFVRNETGIKKLHKILTTGLIGEDGNPYQKGYKKHNNLVGNSPTTDYNQITNSMQSLLSRYKNNKKIFFPLHLAFEFHYRFERIHPFADGNGRIGRLLMNKILYDNKFAPLTIFSDNRGAYFRAFEKSIERGSQILYLFLIDQYKKTFQEYGEL